MKVRMKNEIGGRTQSPKTKGRQNGQAKRHEPKSKSCHSSLNLSLFIEMKTIIFNSPDWVLSLSGTVEGRCV